MAMIPFGSSDFEFTLIALYAPSSTLEQSVAPQRQKLAQLAQEMSSQ